MRKYIFVSLLLLIPLFVSAKTTLDDYNIEIFVKNNTYKVKESFIVLSNDSYETMYEKPLDNAKNLGIESNLDELIINDNYITFYLKEGQKYYIMYDITTSDYLYTFFFAQGVKDYEESIIDFDNLTISIRYNSIKERDNYDININGYPYEEYNKYNQEIIWKYNNIRNDMVSSYISSFSIESKKNISN